MKSRVFIAICSILFAHSVWADIEVDQQDIGSTKINETAKRIPLGFDSHINVIGSSKIRKGFDKGGKVRYIEADAEADVTVYYYPPYQEGLKAGISYSSTYLKWHNNPWFHQDRFNLVSLSLTGFSKRFDRWFWRTQLTANFDAEKWSCQYTSYDVMLWGRYEYFECFGIHLGFLVQTGLKMNDIDPIFGFEWQIAEKWKLNAIYL